MKLEIRDLSKTYANGVEALKKVNLTIPAGMFGLIGPNGAGKSTLMRTIATLQNADEGAAQLDGIDILSEKDKVRRILGYLPQEFGVYHDLTAEQMLAHISRMKGIENKGERQSAVDQILEKTNLIEFKKRKLGGYSGGMKQRFGIAQALVANPQLVIVDEPTAGLDPEERNRFLNLLSEISENIIVILSTHIVDDVRELCEQMAIIREGQILMSGSPEAALQDLTGKVWEKLIPKQEFAEYREQYTIVLSRMFAGNVQIHVMSDACPGKGFEPARPDIDDVYFTVLRG